MKKIILVLAILVLLLALMPAGMAQAKNPLRATTTHDFVGGPDPDDGEIISWKGTISGDIVGNIRWFPGEGGMLFTGQASHYAGSFEITKDGVLLLAGEGNGSTTVRHGKNSNWRTNGIITYAGVGFEEWMGRHVHQSGNFEWAAPGVPLKGVSIFRVN